MGGLALAAAVEAPIPPSFPPSLPLYLNRGRHLVLVRIQTTSELVSDLRLVVHPLLTAVLQVPHHALIAFRS